MKKLILFHGRLNYRRLATSVLYFFYKNILFIWVSINETFEGGFSSSQYWADIPIQLYGILFTSISVLNLGYDEDVYSWKVCLKNPELYRAG
jgi:magnesium-transporting ATPase (P-type)